ncbi:hypothetical protein JCM8097_003405 [Rhodosporidiobolus ruineniae]
MFRNTWLNRLFLRLAIFSLDSVAPLSLLYLVATLFTFPAPAAVAFTSHLPLDRAVDLLVRFDQPLRALVYYAAAETAWWILSAVGRICLDRRFWDYRGDAADEIGSEERFRLWKAMLESSKDPWDWLGGFFLPPGHKRAPRGADDPALKKVKPEQLGRTNVEEFIAHFMFNARLRNLKASSKTLQGSLALSELRTLVLLLEAKFTLLRGEPFRFLRGRSPHRVFRLSQEPLSMGHHPLLFYGAIWVASQACGWALYFAGFRYYGKRSSTLLPGILNPFRTSRRSLESVLDPLEAEKMGDPRLAERVGYYYKPPSSKRLEEDAKPIVFCHGISGLFTVTPFVIGLSYFTGRALFIPELPYLSMRLSPPSAILTRLEYVAAVRRMLWAHGFGLTSLDPTPDDESWNGEQEDEDEWRRAKCVVVAHSFGAGAAGWILRDAPDLVAGTVLVDPMAFLLFSADTPRNFFRTKCKTAGEIFFRYFALERGINHFLSRHLLWSDAVLFGPRPADPLPNRVVQALVPACARDALDPEDGEDVPPFYAPWVSAYPEGPLPSVVFLAEQDCILPIRKIAAYLSSSGFSTSVPPPPYSESKAPLTNGTSSSSAKEAKEAMPSLRIMQRMEHGAVLANRGWCREISRAVEAVATAAERWETGETDDEGAE